MSDSDSHSHERAGSAARGASRLAFEAVTEVARIVEGMHSNIAAAPLPLGEGTDGRTGGITRLVYDGIRNVTGALGYGVDQALAVLDQVPQAGTPLPQPRWDAVASAVNGVLGDHLVARQNPLAIQMQLRRAAQPLEPGQAIGPRPLLLIHGLCMNDREWRRHGHDHGAALAEDLGFTPLYLFYNTGLHISENGRALADRLELHFGEIKSGETASPIEELTIIGHSMGGLVARSAYEYAQERGHTWPRKLGRIVFLGSPHHGAPLERIGNWALGLAEMSPYIAPLARLGMLRSAGISDLRHGSLLDEDWEGHHPRVKADRRAPTGLPHDVTCYAIAGTLQAPHGTPGLGFVGDGLVPLKSALGQHEDPERELTFPDGHQAIFPGIGHLDLLSRQEVYEQIRVWLAE